MEIKKIFKLISYIGVSGVITIISIFLIYTNWSCENEKNLFNFDPANWNIFVNVWLIVVLIAYTAFILLASDFKYVEMIRGLLTKSTETKNNESKTPPPTIQIVPPPVQENQHCEIKIEEEKPKQGEKRNRKYSISYNVTSVPRSSEVKLPESLE